MKKILISLFLMILMINVFAQEPKKYKIMEFRNANINNVLNYISDLTGMTIIPHPDLKGQVTIINKEELTTEQIINILYTTLNELGFTIERKGDILKIVPLSKESVRTEIRTDEDMDKLPEGDQIITQIITLKYAPAESLFNNIKPFLSKYGTISINTKMNKIIITDSASNIKKIFKIVKELDKIETISGKEVELIYLKHISLDRMEKIILDGYYDVKIIDTAYPAMQKLSPRSDRQKEPSLKLIKLSEANGFIVIGTKEEIDGIRNFINKIDIEITPTSDVKLTIIPLKYVSPKKMIELLNQIFIIKSDETQTYRMPPYQQKTETQGNIPLNKTTKIVEFPERNALIVIATDDDLKKIKEVMDVFEKEIQGSGYKAGEKVTKVYNLQNQKAEDVVEIFRALGTYSKEAEPPVFYAYKSINGVIVTAKAEQQYEIEKLLNSLDKRLSQVLIKVLIIEFTYNDKTSSGVDWEQVANIPDSVSKGKIPPIKINQKFGTGPTTGITFQSSKQNFILNALQTIGDYNILSSPHLLTLDNKEASLTIADKIPIVSEEIAITGANQDNKSTSKKYTYVDVGLKLTVKPHINDKKTVTLEMKQTVDDYDPGEDPQHPIINNREITSTIMVGDNETAVLGGLISTSEDINEKRVPLLGSIPLLGYFFKWKSKEIVKRELMLFITPYVILSADDMSKIKDAQIKKLDSITEEQRKELKK